MQQLNLCQILIEEMEKLQFEKLSVAMLLDDASFQTAQKEPDFVQRTMLTMLLNRIFTLGPYIVPSEIRLALSMATDCLGWTEDLKLVILPFLKANEASFFG